MPATISYQINITFLPTHDNHEIEERYLQLCSSTKYYLNTNCLAKKLISNKSETNANSNHK